jgi:hypothetical protein
MHRVFDFNAVAGQGPKILRRAAVRTTLFVLVVVFGLAMFAHADPTGSNYGGINAVTAATAGAPTLAEVAADAGTTKTALNFFFLIVGVALIFFMQAGFMLVETGFCRSKHAAHVAMTNFVIFAVGALAYWAVGFGLQFGSLGAFYWAPGAEGLLTGEAVKFGSNAFAGTKGFLLGSFGDERADVEEGLLAQRPVRAYETDAPGPLDDVEAARARAVTGDVDRVDEAVEEQVGAQSDRGGVEGRDGGCR